MAARGGLIKYLGRFVYGPQGKSAVIAGLVLSMFLAGVVSAAPEPVSSKNVTLVGYMDIEGGGMVDVKGTLAVVGHMEPPYATTLLDVTDPARPRILSRIKTRKGTHSHKARICDNTLVINVERYGTGGDGKAGLALFDIADPRNPKEIAYYTMGGLSTGGTGVHRFQLDCERKLVYASGSADGFQGNFTLILDISNPERPREVGRWWFPGQHVQAGERSALSGAGVRTHHPLRFNNRLYVSLWYGGFAILDISDLSRPGLVSHVNYHDGKGGPTHTALPISHKILGKDWLLVFDEEMGAGNPPAFMRVFDVTDEKRPVAAAMFHVPPDPSGKTGGRFGAHQPHEYVGRDNLVYAAWFSGGLRVIDISNPYRPAEKGHYIPAPARGEGFAESNDLFLDERGLIYLIDRVRGLHILRYTGRKGLDP
jgi:hypothetical protein